MTKEMINITDITEYLYCPRKTYLKKVKKIREKPTKQMIAGKLKHDIFDILNKNERIAVISLKPDSSEEDIFQTYRTQALRITNQLINLNKDKLQRFKISSFDFLNEILSKIEKEIMLRVPPIKKSLKKGFLGQQLWLDIKPKFLTEVSIISENLGLKGRIDRIEIGEKIIPYELKTRAGEIFNTDKLQLAGYALLLEEKFEKPISEGIVETSIKKEKIEIKQEDKKKVLEIAEEIRNLAKEGVEIPISENFKKCELCRFKELCFSV